MAEVILETTGNGCIIPTSHKLNKDGYFRRRLPITGEYVMFHRYQWEQENGKIPEGFEIEHKCKNRACCNLEHLECIDGSEHAILTNSTRYAERLEAAHKYWLETGCRGVDLFRVFGVTHSCACRWIRGWKV
jgi:hypothetical protein